jgi:L-asparagine oxygenase
MLENVFNTVNEYGFVFIKSHRPEESTLTATSDFGTVLQLPSAPDVQVLRPRLQNEAPPNIYSGNYGYSAFPLHTDLAHWCIPPRYLALRCISGFNNVVTRLLDGNELVATIGEIALRRALVQPRRPFMHNRPLLRLLDQRIQATFFRWDSLFVTPATAKSATTCVLVTKYLEAAKPIEIVLSNPGDTLVLDNWRMLHGRSAVPEIGIGRRIERVYMGALQ